MNRLVAEKTKINEFRIVRVKNLIEKFDSQRLWLREEGASKGTVLKCAVDSPFVTSRGKNELGFGFTYELVIPATATKLRPR